jgi:hypothetical protein
MSAAPSYGPVVCWKCDRGRRYVPATEPGKPGRWVPCSTCGGTGFAVAYIYPRMRRGR